jgi:transcriptional regulator with XRE-family HTH domain
MMREAALRGWTNTELSRQVRVSRSTIDKLATQPRPPQSATVLRIAETLGIPDAEALALAGILPSGSASAAVPKMGVGASGTAESPVMVPRILLDRWDDPDVRTIWAHWDDPNVKTIWGLDATEAGRLGLIRRLLGLPDENPGRLRSSG